MRVTFKSRAYTFFIQFVFFNLVDFALGAIAYFSLYVLGLMTEQFNNPNNYYQVLLSNILEAVGSLIAIRLFVLYFSQGRFKIVNYPILFVIVHVLSTITWILMFSDWGHILHWQAYVPTTLIQGIFRCCSPLSGLVVYYFTLREERRSETISRQEYELLEMKELKTKAELETLQAKINPHFLYNALNSIASLIHENPDKAEEMVILLARFFRHSTNAHSQYMTTLADEILIVNTYLEVEKVRFGDRLDYKIWFENEALKDCLIPQFLIQPLVENAIKHGLSKNTGRGLLWIKVFATDNELQILIYDNGPAFPTPIESGYGLRSTQDKLRILVGAEARMEIVNATGNSVSEPLKHIKITMPRRTQAPVAGKTPS